uniref:5'-Nucleotidase C-terminal domain-containing protein n=2 Tax=Anopheles atroparvus TaxID=41427 RepID=A0A182ITP8_ANOAO
MSPGAFTTAAKKPTKCQATASNSGELTGRAARRHSRNKKASGGDISNFQRGITRSRSSTWAIFATGNYLNGTTRGCRYRSRKRATGLVQAEAMELKVFAVLALVAVAGSVGAQDEDADLFPLSIIHFNDLYARFNPVNLEGFVCLQGEDCQGGYARQVAAVRQLQGGSTASLYLNSGGSFKGTLWYTVHRWEVIAAMYNVLPPDAMALGRFDFFHGLEGLNPFMEASEAPVVLTNVDNSAEPTFTNFQRSLVLERDGRSIGILGVIRQDVNNIGDAGNLVFTDPVEAVRTEAARLDAEGVEIIIVLSYSGFNAEQTLAREGGPHVDLVIGAQSNTVLFSGDATDFPLEVEGEYPTSVFQPDGRRVLVVQAGSYGRLVGNLTLFFTEEGEVERWEGNPVFLSANMPEDPAVLTALEPFREAVETLGNRTVAVIESPLSRGDCVTGECAIGSLITDSMVRAFFPVYNGIALQNRGGIRADLPAGTVTFKQLFEVLPFENQLFSMLLRGDYLMSVLEQSVRGARVVNGTVEAWNLLQVSGLRATYRITNPPGRRLVSLEVLCQQCTGEVYEPVNPFREYRVVVASFLAEGGDGYETFQREGRELEEGPVDLDALDMHLARLSPVSVVDGGRIRFIF